MTRLCAVLLAAVLLPGPFAAAQHFTVDPECGRASTPVDKAICTVAVLASANAAMKFALAGLKAELPPDQQTALLVDQQAWLEAREASCNDRLGAALGRCILAQTMARERMLAGGGHSRARGAPRLQPTFFHETRKDRYEIEIAYPQIPNARTAAETAFDKAAHDLILGDPALMGEYRGESGGISAHTVSYDIHYLGPRLATIVFWLVSRNRSWAHPFTAREALVFDFAQARALRPDDVLTAPEQAVGSISALCKKRLDQQAAAEGWATTANANPVAVVANFRNWAPGPFALDILFDAGSIAPEATGMHECRLDYPALSPTFKLNGPLPPHGG